MTTEPTTALSPRGELPALVAPRERIAALPPSAIRARRRPWAIFHVYLYELIFSLVIATPVYAWAGRVWGDHPDGDAVLWAPGGRALARWILDPGASLAIVARTSLVLFVLSAVALQVPLGALSASLAFARDDGEPGSSDAPRPSMRWTAALRIGMASFMALAALFVVWMFVVAILGGLGIFASGAATKSILDSSGEVKALYARLAVLAPFALIVMFLGVILDLARAAIARGSAIATEQGVTVRGLTGLARGLRVAFHVARHSLLRATFAWGWRAVLGLLLVALGAAASNALGGRGGGALFALWIIHQAVVLLRVALRASWLARALGYIEPVQDARIGLPDQGRATSAR